MRTMMITLLLEEAQGEVVLALVKEDCIAVTSTLVEDPRETLYNFHPRVGSEGKQKGVVRTYAERPLGEAILTALRASLDRGIIEEEVILLAVELGMQPSSGLSYLSGLRREGLVRRDGKYGNRRWFLVEDEGCE